MADIFLVQDEIVSQIVAKIAGGYRCHRDYRGQVGRPQEPRAKSRLTTLFCARTTR